MSLNNSKYKDVPVMRAPPTRFISMERRLGEPLPRILGETTTISTQKGIRRIERHLEGYSKRSEPETPNTADSVVIMKKSEHLLHASPKPQNKLEVSPAPRKGIVEELIPLHQRAVVNSPLSKSRCSNASFDNSVTTFSPMSASTTLSESNTSSSSTPSSLSPITHNNVHAIEDVHHITVKNMLEKSPLHTDAKETVVEKKNMEEEDSSPDSSPAKKTVINEEGGEWAMSSPASPLAKKTVVKKEAVVEDDSPASLSNATIVKETIETAETVAQKGSVSPAEIQTVRPLPQIPLVSHTIRTETVASPRSNRSELLSESVSTASAVASSHLASPSSISSAPFIQTSIISKKIPSLKYLQLQEQIRQFLLCEYGWHVPLFEPISHLEQLSERLLSLLSISIRNKVNKDGALTVITEIDPQDYSTGWLAINALLKEAELSFSFSATDVEKNLYILKELLKDLFERRIVKTNIVKIRVEHLLFKHPDQGFSYVAGRKTDLDGDQSIISNPLNFVKQDTSMVYVVLRDASGAILQFDDEFLRSTESMSHNYSSRDATGVPVRFFCKDLDTTREIEIADVEYLASCELKFKIPVPNKKHSKILVMAENCLVQPHSVRNKPIQHEHHVLGIVNIWRLDLISQDEFYKQRILTDHSYLLEKLALVPQRNSASLREIATQRDAILNSQMAAAGVPRVVIAGEKVAFNFKLPHLLSGNASLRLMDSANHSSFVDIPLKIHDRMASTSHKFRRTGIFACMFVQGQQVTVINNEQNNGAKVLRSLRVVPAAPTHFEIISLQKKPQCGIPNSFCLKAKDTFGNEVRKNFFLLVKSSLLGISISLRTNKDGIFSFSMNQAGKFLVDIYDEDSARITPPDVQTPPPRSIPLNTDHPLSLRVHPGNVDFRKTELVGIDGLGNDEIFAGRKKRFSIIFKDAYHNTVNPKRIKVSCHIRHRDLKNYTVSNIQANRLVDRMDFEFCVAHAGVYYINLRFQQSNNVEEDMRFQFYAKPSVMMEHPFEYRAHLRETDLVSMVISFKHALSRDSTLAHEYIRQYQETKKQLMDALHRHRGFSKDHTDIVLVKEHVQYVKQHSHQRRSVLDFLNHHSSEHKNIKHHIVVPNSPQGKGSDEFLKHALSGDKSSRQLAALKMLEYRTKGWILNNKLKRIQCELPIKEVPILENPIQAANILMASQDHISVSHFLKYSMECFRTFKSERSNLATMSLYLQLLLNRSRTGSVNHETITAMLKQIEAESADDRIDPNHPWLSSLCAWMRERMDRVDTTVLEPQGLVNDLLMTSSLSEALISRILLCPFMIDLALIRLSFVFDSLPEREIHCERIDHILELCPDEHLRTVCEKTMEEVFKHTWVSESDVLLLLLILYHDNFEERLETNLRKMQGLSEQLEQSLPSLYKLEGETLVMKEELQDHFLPKKVKNYKVKTLMARGVISNLIVPEENEDMWLKSHVRITFKGHGVFSFDVLNRKNVLQESEISIVECIRKHSDVIRKQALMLDADATMRILDKFVA
uniref:Uncharacterized protein n=1 Tax=Percolomonas cosmopolitus TaxID=63605 RepID=A0A7S1KPF5_9EUKA|mmetsp:Transcript_3917/g.14834  ORF Transcript_3917/g.14834 Transcript_3917/m.14834 type:complete len:1512 (+) Transcript_3917:123-4658(+)|eukprot:CAMPEP_0117440956 /NCGR_PEP_ID=MMETSP0759-20121206/3368_1 /TAXON_ID=63605 /ORGANISM="Percolomonas cosmopolitus, Strain WS" /LENGTH=1511 /DNA_ID=CAMNT_0005232759 /DNA_START=104 /DNA_END=4639 /DNA_ORIENTATION=-